MYDLRSLGSSLILSRIKVEKKNQMVGSTRDDVTGVKDIILYPKDNVYNIR